MEILYKPLIEFQEELVPRGIPMKTIYSIYEEHEKERLSESRDRKINFLHSVISQVFLTLTS